MTINLSFALAEASRTSRSNLNYWRRLSRPPSSTDVHSRAFCGSRAGSAGDTDWHLWSLQLGNSVEGRQKSNRPVIGYINKWHTGLLETNHSGDFLLIGIDYAAYKRNETLCEELETFVTVSSLLVLSGYWHFKLPSQSGKFEVGTSRVQYSISGRGYFQI